MKKYFCISYREKVNKLILGESKKGEKNLCAVRFT